MGLKGRPAKDRRRQKAIARQEATIKKLSKSKNPQDMQKLEKLKTVYENTKKKLGPSY